MSDIGIKRRPKKARKRPEEQLQRAVAQYLDLTGLLWCHVPNERSNALERKVLSRLGVKSGVPDVLIFESYDGASYKYPIRGVAIELKAGSNTLTEAQADWLSQLEDIGWHTAVCRSLDEVVAEVEGCYPHVKGKIHG